MDGTQLLIPTLYITLSPQPYIMPLRFVLLLSIYSYSIVLGARTEQKLFLNLELSFGTNMDGA